MKIPLVFASVFGACLTLGAQNDGNFKLPKDPAAILEMAAPFYNFDSATAKPFRLKYHYRLLDNQGNGGAEGKFECWWSGNVTRSLWTEGNNVHSAWRTSDGRTLQSVKGDDIAGIQLYLNRAVLFSLPNTQNYQSGETSLKLVEIDNAGIANLCVALVPSSAAVHFHADSLQGVGTAYCFDSQAPVLVSTLMNHTVTNSYSHIQKFQDRNIAGHIDISYVGEKRVEADLEESTEIEPDDAAFTPAPDATEPVVKKVTVPITSIQNGGINAGITPGALLERVPLIYPPEARAARISGTVVIQAIIGKDGILKNPRVLSSPDDSLSQAALDCVRQWRYRPYLLNGSPVEVQTTINVEFTLNR
jgi:TonB family protein